MPQLVKIDLPLVISPRGGLTLIRPIGFPEIALASGNDSSALRAVRRRIVKRCSGYVGRELVCSMVRGEAHQRLIRVEIAPERKSPEWREPIQVEFDVFVWQQGQAIVIAYVPPLDLTVVATPQTDLEKLVQEQIRSSIRRAGVWSPLGLARMDETCGMTLSHERLALSTPTAAEYQRKQQEKPKTKTPTLGSVATRLTRKSLRAAYHREDEVAQLSRLLVAQPARPVLMVGPSGVGKTAIFHEWVRSRRELDDGASMASIACWSTDGSRLISGQSGFGMWQQQCLRMADEARRTNAVVHLGNLVELSESGRLRGSGGCGALLAPRLADGSLKAVIECTPEQLTRIQRVEPRLVQALTILRIEEPTSERTRSILLEAAADWRPKNITEELLRKKRKKLKLKRLKRKPETPKPLPTVQPEALQMLDRLHRRFRTDAAAPGRLLAFFHAVMSEMEPGSVLDAQRVLEAFGRQTGLPRFLIDDAVRPDLESIQQQLLSQVIGQDAVIETLVDMIATLAADLSRGDRPLASMMFIGPTGVGKTETAKALARLIYSDVSRLVRIDMSELSTPSAVGRLIGDAMHPEGLLTSAVRAQPFSLVLLDEFEKAHPTVFDLLLQVLGEGRLTDGRGRLADFRNSIVLMTSNLGVETFRAMPLGLADTQQRERYQNHFERQVRDFLRPEMFNRIDRILTYEPLQEETVQQIAGLRIDELKRRDGWQSHGSEFNIDDPAIASLARRGHEPQYGARPLTRELERSVVVPLAESICNSGRLNKLRAEVTSTVSGQQERLCVEVKTEPPIGKGADQNTKTLIEEMTTLRRRGQSLDRCDVVRRLRNQYTMANRKLKALMRRTKNERERDKIRYGPLGVDRMQTRQRISQVRRLCDDIDKAEAQLLADYYHGEAIDCDAASQQIETIRDRLWNMLCELNSDAGTENQRLTLVLTGQDFAPASMLFNAYRRLATTRQWNLQVHALIPRVKSSGADRVITCPGWSDEPAFRVSTEREQMEARLGQWMTAATTSSQTGPGLAAYRLIQSSALTTLPKGTFGVMLTFRGKNAGLMMSGEAGIHTFNRLNQPKSAWNAILVQQHRGMPIEYVAPEWLPRGQFEASGEPRRWYSVDDDLVHDMTEDSTRTLKVDREGRWLETLIEQETERRIWAQLDQDMEPESSGRGVPE